MRLRLLASVVGVVALTLVATADVVLHPGTVAGSVGLSNWTFDNGQVAIYSNTSGYAGSSTFTTASSYSVTVEGGQTYNTVNEYLWRSSPTYTAFSLSVSSPFVVGIGSTVTQNLYTAGATVQAGATATGATINAIYANTYASISSTSSFSGTGYGYSGAGAQVPAAATTNDITVSVNVYLTLNDANGNSCPAYRYYTSTISGGLAEGGTAGVTQAFDLTTDLCPTGTGSVVGTVGLNSLPAGVTVSGRVSFSGPEYQYQMFSSNPFTYSISPIKVGSYYNYAFATYSAPFASTLSFPNGGQYYTDITAGATTTRDFVFDAGTLSGTMTMTGPIATLGPSDSRYFYLSYDYTQPYPGPNAGASSNIDVPPGASGPFGAILTVGRWVSGFGANMYLRNPDNSIRESVYFGSSSGTSTPIDIPTNGASVTADQTLATSEADLTFDVIEPPGQTTKIIVGSPNASLSAYDPATGKSGSIYAYSYETTNDRPTLHVIGAPGIYRGDAYATVNNSYTKFVSPVVNLGMGANTPVGTNVPVSLLDAFGNGLNVDLNFSQVTTAGDTSGSTTNVGPAPPESGFRIVAGFGGSQFLSIHTTAAFNPPVKISIHYDPSGFGLGPGQEKFLALWHYNCAASPCFWEMITDAPPPANPDTVNHVITGTTTSFSVFALMVPEQQVHPPVVECVGTQTAPKIVSTVAGTCSTPVSASNGVAGTCSDGGGGVSSCSLNGQESLQLLPGATEILVQGTSADGGTAECTSFVQVVDMELPSISCPQSQVVECAGPFTPLALTATSGDNCGAATSSCSPGPFSLGTSAAICSATDTAGNSSSCSMSVTVVDTMPPSLSVSASPNVLWPPSHQLVPINLSHPATDVCDPHPAVSCTVSSNQPVNGQGDGNTSPDIIWNNGKLSLRAERSGTSGDRVYTISCTAKDASGNSKTSTATVTVPHDKGK